MENTLAFKNCTVYLTGDFMGNVSAYECREVIVRSGVKYAQYDNATEVRLLQKGKRNWRGAMLTYNPFCVVLPGFTPVQPDSMLGDPEPGLSGSGCTIRKGRYSSFDPRWRSDFRAKLEAAHVAPLFDVQAPVEVK